MKKLLIAGVVIGIMLTGLAFWSYQSTFRRTYGAFNPFAIEIQVQDMQALPIEGAQAKIVNFPAFSIKATPEKSDAAGSITLWHEPKGIEWEYEERYLFWIIRLGNNPPSMAGAYLEVSAPGYTLAQLAIEDVFKQQEGTISMPGAAGEIARYPITVKLLP